MDFEKKLINTLISEAEVCYEMYLDMRQKGNDDRASYWQGKYFMVEDVAMRMFGDKLQKYQSPLDFIKNLERL
jgi:hypothetical protein